MAKVLLIEDNDAVRSVACRVLRSAGHVPCEARDGIEGVEIGRAHV